MLRVSCSHQWPARCAASLAQDTSPSAARAAQQHASATRSNCCALCRPAILRFGSGLPLLAVHDDLDHRGPHAKPGAGLLRRSAHGAHGVDHGAPLGPLVASPGEGRGEMRTAASRALAILVRAVTLHYRPLLIFCAPAGLDSGRRCAGPASEAGIRTFPGYVSLQMHHSNTARLDSTEPRRSSSSQGPQG